MNVTELIKALKEAREKYGDLPVTYPGDPEWGNYNIVDDILLDGIYNECKTSPGYGRPPRFFILHGLEDM